MSLFHFIHRWTYSGMDDFSTARRRCYCGRVERATYDFVSPGWEAARDD